MHNSIFLYLHLLIYYKLSLHDYIFHFQYIQLFPNKLHLQKELHHLCLNYFHIVVLQRLSNPLYAQTKILRELDHIFPFLNLDYEHRLNKFQDLFDVYTYYLFHPHFVDSNLPHEPSLVETQQINMLQ